MSEMSKSARAKMREKAHRMAYGADPHQKVDASSWTPPEPLDTTAKTGMRPISRQARKKGGKVTGEHAKRHAGKKARRSGGLVDDLMNRNYKVANEERSGVKHDGGMKRGGRAKRAGGGLLGSALLGGILPALADGGGGNSSSGPEVPIPLLKSAVTGHKTGGRVKHSDEAEDRALVRKMVRKGSLTGKRRGGDVSDGEIEGTRPTGGRLAKKHGGGFHTPSGGVSAHGRKRAAAKGETLPGTDKFPIRNLADLAKAKHDIGRTNEPHAKVVAYINKRARELGGTPVGEREARKHGGAAKGKGKMNVNIIIAGGHGSPQGQQGAPMPPPGPPMQQPPPPVVMPEQPPMNMGAAAPPMPYPVPMPGGAPMGRQQMPMMRKRGGRAAYDAGAGSGRGRLEKIEEYGAEARKLNGHY